MKNTVLVLVISLTLLSCSKSIDPINYGQDECQYCRMAIVDKPHAAQLVTKKGKNYKFDSSECMINFLNGNTKVKEEDMLHILSADYLHPGHLIDVKEATFLISKKISSPMGAFLSAFGNQEEAKEIQKDFGGTLYNWNKVKGEIIHRDHSKTQELESK